jgi:hypothetical protein
MQFSQNFKNITSNLAVQISCRLICHDLFLKENVVGRYVQLLSYADKSVFQIVIVESVTENHKHKGGYQIFTKEVVPVL